MGLNLRTNAFRGVSHADVYSALADFWQQHGRRTESVPDGIDADTFDLHELSAGWTVLDWTGGWEWTLRRQAQLYASEVLGCPGILVFVYDGDDWGYELFDRGQALDWFVQAPEEGNTWFPGKDLSGRPGAVVSAFPDLALDRTDVAPYLVPAPDSELREQWNVPARPGDRFRRGDECAVLDFLGLLGVPVELTDRYVRWSSPLWSRFRVEPPPD